MLTKNQKIVIIIFSNLFIAFFLVYEFNLWYNENILFKKYNKFYSQEFDHKKERIILIGTSQTARLDPTYIEKKIDENGNFEVYNLSMANFSPEKVIQHIDSIVSMNPKLVVIGIGYFDFQNRGTEQTNTFSSSQMSNNKIPDTKDIISWIIKITKREIDIEQVKFIINNPKLTTLKFLSVGNNENLDSEKSNVSNPPSDRKKIPFDRKKIPFYNFRNHQLKIVSDEQLQTKKFVNKFLGYDEKFLKERVVYFDRIIKKFQNNDIRVILFTTPMHKHYLETIPQKDKEVFRNLMQSISETNSVNVYYFDEKYKDMPIFSDGSHIAIHPDAVIYTQDISDIIIKELHR